MNVELSQESLDEIENLFRFNDAIIRNLVLKMKGAETEPSIMMKEVEAERQRDEEREAARATEEAERAAKEAERAEAEKKAAAEQEAAAEEVADEAVEEASDAETETEEKTEEAE